MFNHQIHTVIKDFNLWEIKSKKYNLYHTGLEIHRTLFIDQSEILYIKEI